MPWFFNSPPSFAVGVNIFLGLSALFMEIIYNGSANGVQGEREILK